MTTYDDGIKAAETKYALNWSTVDPGHRAMISLGAGATVGGALGGGIQALRGRDLPDEERPSILKGVALGAAGGATAGALANVLGTPPLTGPNAYRRAMQDHEYDALTKRFGTYRDQLENHGVYAGTNHKRVIIPKEHIGEDHLRALGFEPVLAGVPESGQDRFTSFRHPDHTLHLHSHPGTWTMHQDDHPAATMLMRSRPTALGRAAALSEGIPHIVTEGVPGMGLYLKNKAQQLWAGSSTSGMTNAIRAEIAQRGPEALEAVQQGGQHAYPALQDLRPKAAEYTDGAKRAFDDYDVDPNDLTHAPPAHHRSWLPALGVAGVAGLGAYAAMRHPSFSNVAGLKALQQGAGQKGFHRVVEVNGPKTFAPNASIRDRLVHAFTPTHNEAGVLDWKNRLLLNIREGEGAIPVASKDSKQWVALPGHGPENAGKPVNVEGVVRGRQEEAGSGKVKRPMADLVQGGEDIEGPQATLQAMNELGKSKMVEADLLQKHAPGMMPETMTDLSALHQQVMGGPGSAPPDRQLAVQRAQALLAQQMGGERHVLKPKLTMRSQGQFPWSDQPWAPHIQAFDTKMQDPAFAAKLEALKAKGGGEETPWLRAQGVLPGYTLDRFMHDPSTVFAQKAIPSPENEWRVHVVRGAAPPSMMIPRGRNRGAQLKHVAQGVPKEMQSFVEDHFSKLPADLQQGSYGLDVMPYRKPDGSRGYKVIELNPTDSWDGKGTTGGGSGFISTRYNPFMGQTDHRQATGRWSKGLSGMTGVGAGLGAGALARAATPDDNPDQPEGSWFRRRR